MYFFIKFTSLLLIPKMGKDTAQPIAAKHNEYIKFNSKTLASPTIKAHIKAEPTNTPFETTGIRDNK